MDGLRIEEQVWLDYFRDKSSDLSLFPVLSQLLADVVGASDITFGCSGKNHLFGVR